MEKDTEIGMGGATMNITQIEYFIAAAQSKSFAEAAENIYTSRPAVSKQILSLEEELGVTLFQRNTKGVALTRAGQILFDYFMDSQEYFSNALRQARLYDGSEKNVLIMATPLNWNIYRYLKQIKQFVEELPGPTALVVLGKHPEQIREGLENGEVDAAICMKSGIMSTSKSDSSIHNRFLTYNRRILLFSSQHPLSKKPDLIPSDFSGETMYFMSNRFKPMFQEELLLVCNRYDIHPRLGPLDGSRSARLTVGSGQGFTIADEWFSEKDLPDFSYLYLDRDHEIDIFWSENNKNQALPSLLEFCLQLFQEDQPV